MTSSPLSPHLFSTSSELLVYGYTNGYFESLFTSNFIPLFPETLCKIIFLYFFSQPRDTWDRKCMCNYFEIVQNEEEEEGQKKRTIKYNYLMRSLSNNTCDINENGPLIMVTRDYFGSAYLKNIVYADKHNWKFKIEGEIVDPMEPNYHSWRGRYAEHKTVTNYGIPCKKGDIIDMHLDFYAINGQHYGIAFSNIEQTYYRAVVGLYCTSDCIRLLSYKEEIDIPRKMKMRGRKK